ncbi:S8 family serine peptidase [Plectonema cf. radiosum LEGE 06105]|uniref:S8 family serine peptidase n=1 Tax=Plectonema cf. radiosum LEGE 06105 TaxID=945769 RepID=A0A8J7EXL4_9CYAN|nr:S8 family peptidase [Plectonema radiosum]MBE9211663.1 S8 family serine peptidase [Plectonema cf. radiosum LEGE 06105]
MQPNLNDSNLFPETTQNNTAFITTDELNFQIEQNNLNLLSRSSFESSTDDSIVKNSEETVIPYIDNNIQLNSQQNIYTSSSQGYNSENGYGLANAAAAVAKIIGEDTFANVPEQGGKNWGADAVKAPSVWEKGYTGQGVVVAVLDTGVDRNHDDLKQNIWTNQGEIPNNGKDDDGNGYVDDVYGWNFDGKNNNTIDVDGHGTHVSGTIAGTKNDFGVTGIAYDAQIMPVKVLDDFGSGSTTAVANGIYYAADNGADVINLSLGGSFPSFSIERAVEYANSKGVIVVMAAGNSSGETPLYPARYADKYGIAVGAIDKDKNMARFSNRAGTDALTYLTAPGVDIYSTLPNNRYDSYSGTSMATPHIAGVVALMLSANPNLNSNLIRQTLEETASNNIQTISLKFDSSDLIQGSSFTSNFDAGYPNKSFSTSLDFGNTETFNLSPNQNINKSVNLSFESQLINYQHNSLGNKNNPIFNKDFESMLEEPDFLF